MRKQLLFTLTLLLCVLLSFGQNFTSNGINYTVTSATSPLTVSVAPTPYFSGDANIPATVTNNSEDYSVTNIGFFAFNGCTSLTSITIPNSVTSIESNAFYNCPSLTSVTIPNSVISIGDAAFTGCTDLTSITIPNSVTSIENGTFNGCTSLTSVTIPTSVTSIGSFAFYNCPSLTSITIPNSVTSIESYAFAYTGLTSITIPNSVTNIGDAAFNGCTSLTSITIPNSVTSIGSSAFYYCPSLTSVTIPNSVTSIGNNAFAYTGLTSITIPNSVTSIGDSAFAFTDLTSVTIPNSVTSIENQTFYNCTNLTSVAIPNSVTRIGSYAFYNCTSLTSVTIPTSVTSIGSNTFFGCTRLTSVNLPNSVTSIGSYTFFGCTGLTSVSVSWVTPLTSIHGSAFLGITTLASVKLYVPAGTEAAYDATTVWTDFNILSLPIATQSQSNVSCFGEANGTATVTALGGTAPYTYSWSPSGGNAETVSGLAAGDYTCTITDHASNNVTSSFTITQPDALPHNVTTIAACATYTWGNNNQTYTESGTYTGTTTNCVTEKLQLTITPTTSNTTTVSVVGGYKWAVNGSAYLSSGTYSSVNNCSTQILNLTITPIDVTTTVNNGVITANQTNATYQWFNCDTEKPIANQTSQSFAPTVSGNYAVQVFVNDYNSLSNCVSFTTLGLTTDTQISGIKLYPNPSTGIFNLELPKDLQLDVYNNLGQKILSQKSFTGTNTINISEKASGTYFLKATDGNTVNTIKLIKK
jgi:hypothetical protein